MLLIVSKIIALVLTVLVLSRSISDYRSRKESLFMTIFWSVIWLIICAIALYPQMIDMLIVKLGNERAGLGTIIGVALIFVMFINYRVYIKANRVEKSLDEINRKIALRKIKK